MEDVEGLSFIAYIKLLRQLTRNSGSASWHVAGSQDLTICSVVVWCPSPTLDMQGTRPQAASESLTRPRALARSVRRTQRARGSVRVCVRSARAREIEPRKGEGEGGTKNRRARIRS